MRAPIISTAFLIFTATTPAVAERIAIPAGSFHMGCSVGDPACGDDEGPVGGVRVDVPAFLLDRNEVTVAEFRACVASGDCSEPLTNQRNQYCNYGHAERDEHPVNCLDWGQAVAYCQAQGGRLPTEPEWEYAARAGSSSRYPWGEAVDCSTAIVDEVSPDASDREPDGCYTDATWPVGSRAANAFGLFDMHGNAGEWTASWYAPDALTAYYAKGDLAGPADGRQRVVRGGSWDENRPNLRSSFRNVKPPEQDGAIYGSVGFRCAADAR
ncbi:formylglycine-generating enzyme family protein [Thiosocius teredinicola]|uniref:formylglycine-generating enzyme family protein n=1 Tax=Thiosocius teredinicola TaxID=1973002 RepID=UPI000990F384